jgi:hypothetical protein
LRIGDVNFVRELFTIDVYATVAPLHPERDAVIAPPWSTLPWHLIVLMEEAVARGWAAFSEAEAARRGVAWLDLVRLNAINRNLASLAESFEREGYRPEALQARVSGDEARQRWAALIAFYKMHGHFLVTNGPYQVKSRSADGVVLAAFRDLTYPLGVGSYDAYAVPRQGFVTKVEHAHHRTRIFADIETIMKFQRDYRLVREPMLSAAAEIVRRASPECRYVVLNEAGRVVLTGVERPADDRTFQVDLNGRLPAGHYTMLALIAVNENATNAEIRRIPIAISSGQ